MCDIKLNDCTSLQDIQTDLHNTHHILYKTNRSTAPEIFFFMLKKKTKKSERKIRMQRAQDMRDQDVLHEENYTYFYKAKIENDIILVKRKSTHSKWFFLHPLCASYICCYML